MNQVRARCRSRVRRTSTMMLAVALSAGLTSAAMSPSPSEGERSTSIEFASAASSKPSKTILLTAARVFDGDQLRTDLAVLVEDGKVKAVRSDRSLRRRAQTWIELGDATILPGFIELHSHVTLARVPHDTVLKHGVTTVREVGGPLLAPSGGDGTLRVLGAGPTLTSPGGYPIPVFPEGAVAVTTEAQARQAVRDRVAGGAVVIKVGLDRGGEPGAPWSSHGPAHPPPPWSLLDVGVLRAIVDEAHRHGRLVTAHVGEPEGVERSLDGGVDEWAHLPCNEIPPALLQRAVTQGVKIVGTLDTLSHCQGLHHNARTLASFGATFLYGAEVAHNEIPWGIDAQELQLMVHLEGLSPIQAFRAATSAAGRQLGLAPLGTLTPGAPADLIAVPGDAFMRFKPLEYPSLVMSGGKIVVNDFTSPRREVNTAPE